VGVGRVLKRAICSFLGRGVIWCLDPRWSFNYIDVWFLTAFIAFSVFVCLFKQHFHWAYLSKIGYLMPDHAEGAVLHCPYDKELGEQRKMLMLVISKSYFFCPRKSKHYKENLE